MTLAKYDLGGIFKSTSPGNNRFGCLAKHCFDTVTLYTEDQ